MKYLTEPNINRRFRGGRGKKKAMRAKTEEAQKVRSKTRREKRQAKRKAKAEAKRLATQQQDEPERDEEDAGVPPPAQTPQQAPSTVRGLVPARGLQATEPAWQTRTRQAVHAARPKPPSMQTHPKSAPPRRLQAPWPATGEIQPRAGEVRDRLTTASASSEAAIAPTTPPTDAQREVYLSAEPCEDES